MSVPSMVHRSGDSLVVRSVVSGDALFVEDVEQLSDDSTDLPECKIRRNYSCAACDYFTQNPRHFLYHQRDVHNEKVRIYECPNCLYASKHFQKLVRHARMVHGTEATPEMKKPQEESEEEEEEEQVEEDIGGKQTLLKCSLCSFTARNQQQLAKHGKEEHIKTKFFRCTKCTYVTHMKARFTKHVKYHSMPMIKCEMCDFRTPYKWNLDRHCKNHNGKGAFRCGACNFTADIKQSLTVHEMNHHVPPVGQAAGLGVGRRRNKVGASDSVAAEDAQAQVSRADLEPSPPAADDDRKTTVTPKLKIPPAKKQKTTNSNQEQQHGFGSDFIHPDDIIHHANGNIYIKNKCKLCNFKSAWTGEMARHEKKVHNIVRNAGKVTKKTPRPVPNLIPIPAQSFKAPKPADSPPSPLEHIMSQKDINDICAKSANSTLKDFAPLFDSEDVFKTETKEAPKIPDLIPATPLKPINFKQKNASFFDKLKEKLLTGTGTACNNLTCQYCGHESKCLTEFASHQKACGKETVPLHSLTLAHNLSSTRCQFCRQRCKSSSDLVIHLQTCSEALKSSKRQGEKRQEEHKEEKQQVEKHHEQKPMAEQKSSDEETIKNEPHPMENRVFVWNNIEVPMDTEADDSAYEYTEDKQQEDNVSYDLSVRTQSPGSENSYVSTELVHNPVTPDKIPTHGNDISVAQHKRVFKCPHCSFWASTASRFHVHIVGHLNKKPFECSLCAYRSNWRWDITKHIKLKSVRDPAHESAKVLMTDETGRRNYTKYNKYLTEIHVSSDQQGETSGGSGTRPKNSYERVSPSQLLPSKAELPKLTRAPSSSDFSPLLRSPLRPPPPLKAADGTFFAKLTEKKRSSAESKKTLWKCKKCNFRDASHEKLLVHVKGHYSQQIGGSTQGNGHGDASSRSQTPERDEASVGGALLQGHAPFRCGHCQQVSNWKHVIQRHCRLKHGGDIRVVIGSKNGTEKLEIDDQVDEPDHIDLPQLGTFKCNQCPFSNDHHEEFEMHLTKHSPRTDSITKCHYCSYFVSHKTELYEHLKLHGITDPESFVIKMMDKGGGSDTEAKRYQCLICPYVTNSKSQYLYHKQFHKPRGGEYTCTHCTYNVSKRHLLHQHLKVHGINMNQKHGDDVIDLDDINEEIEEVPQEFPDIPLVWVSKNGKFSKMFKCRFCPHVNSRKVNIQEHEKMHGTREKNPNVELEHHCTECNYVCNNAGVLSSHSKVHQGICGVVHCLVDPTKSDEEQINELSRFLSSSPPAQTPIIDTITLDDEDEEVDVTNDNADVPAEAVLYFCEHCPARFLRYNEFQIHSRFHGVRLFYKCDYCSYTARQRPHLLAHESVHSQSYQERTKELQALYQISQTNPPPQVYPLNSENGGTIYVALEITQETTKYTKTSQNVPISGTELFQQKSEAQQKQLIAKSPPEVKSDPQFGTLMHGNPNFVYPTYLKNGKMKEKRYKCHKCPSAFEKREQYKTHLGLHGSKQRYKCEHCDYSVKYYANYVQHLKKHQMNEDAHGGRKTEDEDEEMLPELSTADKQTAAILQNRESGTAGAMPVAAVAENQEERKLFWCTHCPYTSHRKDAVDNHQKRHVSISGVPSNYTCKHCDYTVPQAHFLRDHTKLHFGPNKIHHADGFLVCENMKLTGKRVEDAAEENMEDDIIFEDNSTNTGDRFMPPLNDDVKRRFNNNDGEREFVNIQTGEMEVHEKKEDQAGSSVDEN